MIDDDRYDLTGQAFIFIFNRKKIIQVFYEGLIISEPKYQFTRKKTTEMNNHNVCASVANLILIR